MDIIVKKVLSIIQSNPDLSQTILAGGAVRDSILGMEPKDYDFCIPRVTHMSASNLVYQIMENLTKAFPEMLILNPEEKGREYAQSVGVKRVYGVEILGRKIDLIFTHFFNTEDFAQKVLDTFDYGLCKVYFDGNIVNDSDEHFQSDLSNNEMTLLKLESLSHLPKAIDRFNRINKRFKEATGMQLFWNCPSLIMVPQKSPEEEFKSLYSSDRKYRLKSGYHEVSAAPAQATENVPLQPWSGIQAQPQQTPIYATVTFPTHSHNHSFQLNNQQATAFSTLNPVGEILLNANTTTTGNTGDLDNSF
jgi:Poly A polymerase head domain